jgi:hypothetical protein
MNNHEGTSSSILTEIDDFLNDGQPVVDRAERAEVERAAFIEKRIATERKLPPAQFPRSRIGVNEATGKTYRDEDTKEEWEVPDYGYDERTPDLPKSPEDISAGAAPGNSLDRVFFNMEEQEWETQMQIAMEHKDEAVLVLGESGVGKTTMVEAAAEKYGLKVAYFNAPTMDPYLNLVGIPNVRKDEKGKSCLEFVRKHDLEHVDMIFLDEINRVSHATQNQLFELVHARTINGVPFRRLRSVWAAINPPRDDITRAVQEMESALGGRFMTVIHVEAAPRIHHFVGEGRKGQIGMSVARTCLRWWYQEIFNAPPQEGKGGQMVHLQDIVTPRVLYYIMRKVQRLNNDVYNPRPGEQAKSLVWWNRGFNTIAQHHKISSKTWGVNMPYEQLKRALLGDEIVALSSLRNDSPEVEQHINEIKADPMKGLKVAEQIEAGLRKVAGKEAQIPLNEIGDFSRIICAMNPNASSKILRQDLAWYLFAKHNKTPEWRKQWATHQGFPNDPITLAPTQGETDIYNRCKKQIDQTISANIAAGAERQLTPGLAPTTPGAGKVAGGLGGGSKGGAVAPGGAGAGAGAAKPPGTAKTSFRTQAKV